MRAREVMVGEVYLALIRGVPRPVRPDEATGDYSLRRGWRATAMDDNELVTVTARMLLGPIRSATPTTSA